MRPTLSYQCRLFEPDSSGEVNSILSWRVAMTLLCSYGKRACNKSILLKLAIAESTQGDYTQYPGPDPRRRVDALNAEWLVARLFQEAFKALAGKEPQMCSIQNSIICIFPIGVPDKIEQYGKVSNVWYGSDYYGAGRHDSPQCRKHCLGKGHVLKNVVADDAVEMLFRKY